MFGCCFQKPFFVFENRKHSKTCLTIVPCVFNLFSMFSIWYFWKTISSCFPHFLHYELNKKKEKKIEKKKTTCREQITNPLKMHHTTNWTKSQIHTQRTNLQTLKFVFSIFFPLISFSKWKIGGSVDDDDNAAIWTLHWAMEVDKYACVREIWEGVGKWRWGDEWGKKEHGFNGSTSHEKREREIMIKILEDEEEGGEEKIICG